MRCVWEGEWVRMCGVCVGEGVGEDVWGVGRRRSGGSEGVHM